MVALEPIAALRYNKGVDRLSTFNELKTHPWLGRVFRRLTQQELELARSFLLTHAGADAGTFEMLVNRMFLDRPKPKHHTIIMELLVCANSASRPR